MSRRQYTIRAVPDHVDQALRRRAREQHKSLNTVIVETLEQAMAPPSEPIVHHGLDFLIGTWVDDSKFDEAMEECERIDEEDWK
ncbi:MAG: Arc family DNA-binding protein [Planctomycetaceae bacterium]